MNTGGIIEIVFTTILCYKTVVKVFFLPTIVTHHSRHNWLNVTLAKGGDLMGAYSLFELFLVIFTYHALVAYEGSMRVLVPLLCLMTVLLFERLQLKLKEEP